mgnify:CR=1 FL=1
MINTRQTTTINLTLTEDEFDDLYDVVEETIYNIKDNLENTGWELNDYEIYKVFQQMNRFREGKI